MNLQYNPALVNALKDTYLLLDSTTFINASKSDGFLELLVNVVATGCTFVTIPSVTYEFTRGSQTLEAFSKQLEFIKSFGTTVFNRIEETIDSDMRIFLMAYNRAFRDRSAKKAPSYTDSLLCLTAYKYRSSKIKLITANYKDIPDSIFDKEELITIDIGGDLRNEVIYSFSPTKFNQALRSLEKA